MGTTPSASGERGRARPGTCRRTPASAGQGSRVVGLPRRRGPQRLFDFAEERLPLQPPLGDHQHLRRRAVEARVVRHHPRDLPRLEVHVRRGPGPGHDQHRRHAAELRGERLLVLRIMRRLATLLLVGRGAPRTIAVSYVLSGAGHVERVDARVLRESTPLPARRRRRSRGSSAVDQRRERACLPVRGPR